MKRITKDKIKEGDWMISKIIDSPKREYLFIFQKLWGSSELGIKNYYCHQEGIYGYQLVPDDAEYMIDRLFMLLIGYRHYKLSEKEIAKMKKKLLLGAL